LSAISTTGVRGPQHACGAPPEQKKLYQHDHAADPESPKNSQHLFREGHIRRAICSATHKISEGRAKAKRGRRRERKIHDGRESPPASCRTRRVIFPSGMLRRKEMAEARCPITGPRLAGIRQRHRIKNHHADTQKQEKTSPQRPYWNADHL